MQHIHGASEMWKQHNTSVLPLASEHSSDSSAKVEICAGQGQLTQALKDCGMSVKAFDASKLHLQTKYIR